MVNEHTVQEAAIEGVMVKMTEERAELIDALTWAVGKIEGMGGDAGHARKVLDKASEE